MKTTKMRISIGASALAILFVCGLVATAIAGLTPDQAQELGEIQKAIKAKGAKWTAGETSVLKLSPEARRRLCGLLFAQRPGMVTSSGGTDTLYSTEYESFPATFDWRYDADENAVTPVKDQGSCGSCWAFASVGAMESAMVIAGYGQHDLSEQLVVSCDNANDGCCGGYMDRVYDYLMTDGTTDEACFDYYASGYCQCTGRRCRDYTLSCDDRCADWDNRVETISSWEWVGGGAVVVPEVMEIKEAVQQWGPIPAGFDVYDDFFSYTGGIYEHVTGRYAGGHAVVIIGWQDPEGDNPGCWIAKNSWGTDGWGEDGFFRIKWDDCRIGTDAAVLHYESQACPDVDGDGYQDEACGGDDCNDDDDAINPGAQDSTCDGTDNNCDGYDGYDADGDGYSTCGGDCNDNDAAVHPGAAEVPYNGKDDDCNGGTPDDDLDGDNYPIATDCDDNDPAVNPGAEDSTCDGTDNNCDGHDGYDGDGDGYSACGGDCNDTNAAVNPGVIEVCGDNIDNNCNGTPDEGCTECAPVGTPCATDDECCSGKCIGRPGRRTCK